jgi:hypothetical protein
VERSSCGLVYVELLYKEAAFVICCWNYCGKKQLLSSISEITVQRSGFNYLLLELL